MNLEKSTRMQFAMRTYQASMFWLPAAIWGLFVIMVGLFGKSMMPVETSSAYTGVVLPLVGGILAAYAVLDDPALELLFATPRSAMRMLMERLGVILAVLLICAVTYQIFTAAISLDMSRYGNLWQRQAAWIAPCLAMTLLGFFASFAAAGSHTAAMLVGMVWIIQVVARDWFMVTPGAQQIFLFTGALYPEAPTVVSSQIGLVILSVILFAAGLALFRKQERYI